MTNGKKSIPDPKHVDEIEHVRVWMQKYGGHLLTGLLVVLIAITAFNVMRTRMGRRAAEAGRRLVTARSAGDLEAVILDFGKSRMAPLAVLSLAKLHYDNGQYEAALSQYDRFLARWPAHDMADVASLGRLFCIESRDHHDALEEAADAFAAFASERPGHYLTPQAVFGHARCLEQLERFEAARAIYEDFIAQDPGNAWSLRAEELLAAVQRRIRRGAAGAVPAVVEDSSPEA